MPNSSDALGIVLVGAVIFAALAWLWQYHAHHLLADRVFGHSNLSPLTVRMLSLAAFTAALLVVWLLAGISVLTYAQALLAVISG